ncbi:MAG: hypothetical protein BBJ57_02275 [Desulfobacterales bacterium PC51MH44]|nr:MAG: hypothetical protein BBJ57_02275 [Desulfobacterales bacterium PC51MH44]
MDKIKSSGIGDQIFKLWDEGFSGDKIAVMTGGIVGGRSVIRFLNRNGVKTDYTKRTVKCHECGIEFEKVRCCFRKSRLHFCSMPCYWKHLKNPEYIRSVYGSRVARKVVRECGYLLSPEEVVHHIDSNANNNDPNNLMVFRDQGDHIRWHRNGGGDSGVVPVWPVEFSELSGVPELCSSGFSEIPRVESVSQISESDKKMLEAAQETVREKYKRLNPKSRCMKCQKFNRDCVCE